MRKYFYSLCKIAVVTFLPITIERVGHRMRTLKRTQGFQSGRGRPGSKGPNQMSRPSRQPESKPKSKKDQEQRYKTTGTLEKRLKHRHKRQHDKLQNRTIYADKRQGN